jgi:AraC-like DNA-binding protein
MQTLTQRQNSHLSSSWDKVFYCLTMAGQLRTRLLELVHQSVKEDYLDDKTSFHPEAIKDELIRLCGDYQQLLSQTFQSVSSEVKNVDVKVLNEYLADLNNLLREQAVNEQQYATEIQNSAGLARHCLNNLSHYGVNFQQEPQLKKVFEYIEENYHNAIGLCDVAQTLGYSTAYLTDFVRRKTGQTVNQWIISRRLSEACHLLLTTNQSIESIAMSIGYQNVGHFFRQFRKNYDSTPQTWRNKMRIQAGANINQEVDNVEKLIKILA